MEPLRFIGFLLAALLVCAAQTQGSVRVQVEDDHVQLDEVLNPGHGEVHIPGPAQVPDAALRLDAFDLQWRINATDILEKVHGVLAFIERKIDEITASVEESVKNALDVMEKAADGQAKRWNDMIDEWKKRAEADGVDIKECLQQQDSLAAEIQGLRKDARSCADTRVADVRKALRDVEGLRPVAEKLVADTITVVQACVSEANPGAGFICLLQKVPHLAVRATRLGVDATLLSGRVGAKAAAIGPLASLCASKAAAGRAAAVSKIIDSTVKCIQGKLGQ